MPALSFIKSAGLRMALHLPELKGALKTKNVLKSDEIFLDVVKSNPEVRSKLIRFLVVSGITTTATTLSVVSLIHTKQMQMTGCFRYEFNSTSGRLVSMCKVAECTCSPDASTVVSKDYYLCAPSELVKLQRKNKCPTTDPNDAAFKPCTACDMTTLIGAGIPSNVIYSCQTPSKLETAGLIIDWTVAKTGSVLERAANTAFEYLHVLINIVPYVIFFGATGLVLFIVLRVFYRRHTAIPPDHDNPPPTLAYESKIKSF